MNKEHSEVAYKDLPPTGLELIIKERERQITQEGWTKEHDDKQAPFSMSNAGACYAMELFKNTQVLNTTKREIDSMIDYMWPWDGKWWKPTPDDPVRQLVKAGALIAAEIDRLQRLRK